MFAIAGFILILTFMIFAFRSLRVSVKQTFLLIRNFVGALFTRPKYFKKDEE